MIEDLPVLQTISNIGNIPHLSNSDPESNTPSKVTVILITLIYINFTVHLKLVVAQTRHIHSSIVI